MILQNCILTIYHLRRSDEQFGKLLCYQVLLILCNQTKVHCISKTNRLHQMVLQRSSIRKSRTLSIDMVLQNASIYILISIVL